MSALNPNLPTAELARVLTGAANLRESYRKKLLTPQLVLLTMLEDKECGAYQILTLLSKDRGVELSVLHERAKMMAQFSDGRDAHFSFTDDFGKAIPLAEETLVALDEGLSIAQSRDQLKVGSAHMLAVLATTKVTTGGALQKVGLTSEAIIGLLDEIAQEGETPVIHDHVHDAQQGDARPVYQREELLREMMSLLSLAGRPNIILVGAEGAGKRTLVYSLAQLIAEGRLNNIRSVVELNEVALLENPLQAMRVGLRRSSGGILLVPGLERFFGGRLRAKFPEQVCRDLQKAILGDEQTIIGTTTPGNFELLSQEDLVRQQMHRLTVPAADRGEAAGMLQFHKARYEQEYGLQVSREAFETAVSLADQYIKTIALPASAVQLMDRSCALVHMAQENVLAHQDHGVEADGVVDAADVMVAASQMTKVPVHKLGEDEQNKYANMVEHIQKRLIGQDEAVLAVSRAVKIARVGLRNPKRPIGSFLFLGPSGVGKSELAKALAEFMFGSEDSMLVLDMSEYQEESSLNRLIGAPPGYVGYQGGGQLTNYVRENPYTVVLFDEVEKAHQRIFDVLLQVLDEGRLTDGQGRMTTFSETVVIMTSNLGAKHLLTPVLGERERVLVMDAVHSFFRPEFLNRIDDTIMFHQLTPEQLAKILDLMLGSEQKLAKQQNLDLVVAPAAKEWLLAQNDQPEFGARPLRRLITRYVREPLADHLLSAGVTAAGAVVMVDAVTVADGEDAETKGSESGLAFEVIPN